MTKLGKAYLSLFTCILSFIMLGAIVSLLPNTDRNEPPIPTEDELLTQNCNHIYGEWETSIEPTCTTKGTEKQICTICNYENTRAISTLAHSYEIFREEKPTCFERGTAIYKCANCTASYVEDLPPQHTYITEEAIAPTCTTDGYTRMQYCSVCEEVFVKREVVKATGHDWFYTGTIDANCTDDGEIEYSCSTCGAYKTETDPNAPSLGHTPSEWIISLEPTCTETGTKRRACAVCGEVETATIEATGHDWFYTGTIDANCTDDGEIEYSCSTCGAYKTETDPNAPSLGHTPSDWIIDVEPTETTEGSKHKVCTVCGDEIDTATIPKLVTLTYTLKRNNIYSVRATVVTFTGK